MLENCVCLAIGGMQKTRRNPFVFSIGRMVCCLNDSSRCTAFVIVTHTPCGIPNAAATLCWIAGPQSQCSSSRRTSGARFGSTSARRLLCQLQTRLQHQQSNSLTNAFTAAQLHQHCHWTPVPAVQAQRSFATSSGSDTSQQGRRAINHVPCLCH